MNIIRRGHTFTIKEVPATSSWGFWGLWCGSWEEELLSCIDRLLPEDGTLLDLGAWVGPITLWAARLPHRRVIAVEPDPTAGEALAENVRLNAMDNVRVIREAAMLYDGKARLWCVRAWGESTPSLTFEQGDAIDVPCFDVERLIREEAPSLVKCDIEGGEALILPVIGPLLRERGIPLLLSLHWGQYPIELQAPLDAELALWDLQPLSDAGASFLCTRKGQDGTPQSG